MKNIIKKVLGERLVLVYHYTVAHIACLVYGNPSRKLTVIGVTGTKGKTTTANYIWAVLSAGGIKTGLLSTVNFRIGEKVKLNDKHMTMPGRFFIQRKLRKMLRTGCTHVVVETPSEGIKQHRHSCINYSIAVFTNLTPEHLPSHGGSFENYKHAKGKLFAKLAQHRGNAPTLIIANKDSEHADYYLSFDADEKKTYTLLFPSSADFYAGNVKEESNGVKFVVDGEKFELPSPGRFNVYNALPAIIIAKHFGINKSQINKGFATLGTIPGRMEEIKEGQDFRVFVDYAHEEASMRVALSAMRAFAGARKLIVVLGAEGGGRDTAKRALMGAVVAELGDFVITTNVDPYDDDPMEIIEDIARAAEDGGKVLNKNLLKIENRRLAIQKALSLASTGDIVLITGKGAEQSMIIGGKELAWDDRKITKELLQELKK